ncbi:hypothetical protein SISSUDRAFT_1054879 [Sistotremastrum suecicum HHB10207 ss-3]|uniref:F-box domain-containing protein n=1 Tax=Sistotremastrum suecicum HHB10207 ss-3 TaxID=1314776 RepID=A0A165Y6P0_9AGAM|nr:hypothetical protein SISSUDRAFT_1054879 [Sistotremastrum suecicum HHB10207 ss-3]
MKDKIERSMKLKHNLCIPIGRLSDELITEVLRYGIDTGFEHSFLTEGFPLFPTYSICTRWRNVAINSPSLWYRIPLPCPQSLFRLIRDRSRNHSLNVFLLSDSEYGELNTALLGESLRQLAPRIHKLQVLWSKVATQPDIPTLENFLSVYIGHKEFSVLRDLDLTDTFDDDPERNPIVLNIPALLKLRFNGAPKIIPRSIASLIHLDFKWSRLKISEILDLLSYYPQLKTCSITNPECCGDLEDEDDHDVVALNQLESLVIDFVHLSEMQSILAHLTLPVSARLTLGTYLDEPDDILFHNFIGPYLSKCEELKISDDETTIIYSMTYQSRGPVSVSHGFPDGPPAEIDAFPALSLHSINITLLDIRYSILPSLGDIIDAFTAWSKIAHIRVCTEELEFERLLTALEDTPTVVCPLLRTLDCTGTQFSSLRMKQFLDFREKKGVCIQTLKFTRGFAHYGVDELLSSATTTIVQSDPVEHQVDDSTET